ncbi:MAG: thioredoxin family protein [Prevotella sp.]|nr:thioredoxin family protein [Prevotella sp.]
MRVFKIAVPMIAFAMATPVCARQIEGVISDPEIEKVTLVFCPNGISEESRYVDAAVNNGRFDFSIDGIDAEGTDVEIVIGRSRLGAHIYRDSTLLMRVTKSDIGYSASFSGAGSQESRFYNRYVQAYNIVRYFSLNDEKEDDVNHFLQLLASEYQAVKAMLPVVGNFYRRAYYEKLNDSKYKSMQAYLLANHARKTGKNVKNCTEYTALLNDIDINDDIHRKTGLVQKALLMQVGATVESKCDATPFCQELMQITCDKVSNPLLRREIVRMVGNHYFAGDGSGDNQAFWNDFAEFAGADNADILLQYNDALVRFEQLKRGNRAPDVMLTRNNDTTVWLSEIASGKTVYIDVWATWCGPCLAEMPAMVQLVEKFKDNPKVMFVSISVDKDADAWKKHLQSNPSSWAQYHVQGEAAHLLSKHWHITSIPRFIIIDRHGLIYSADAPRPSSPRTEALLQEISEIK